MEQSVALPWYSSISKELATGVFTHSMLVLTFQPLTIYKVEVGRCFRGAAIGAYFHTLDSESLMTSVRSLYGLLGDYNDQPELDQRTFVL
jgi:hypothetical protein